MNSPFNIVCFYRPPSCPLDSFITDFSSLLNNVNYSNCKFILLGDINHNLHSINKSTDKVYQFFQSYAIKPINNTSTRTTTNSATCIDWILCNSIMKCILQVKDNINTCFSDHDCINVILKKSRNQTIHIPSQKKIIFSKASITDFSKKLAQISPGTLDDFVTDITSLSKDCFKYVDVICHNSSPEFNWLSNKFKLLSHKRNKAYTVYMQSKSPANFNNFKRLKNLCNYQARTDKKNYFHTIINKFKKCDPKKMWKILNAFIKKKTHTDISIINHQGNLISDTLKITNIFNNFFSSIVPELKAQNGFVCTTNPCQTCNFFTHCLCNTTLVSKFYLSFSSQFEVLIAIFNCKPSSVDTDFITKQIILLDPFRFASLFEYFINDSFLNSKFPQVLKNARIIPTFKSGDHKLVNNYRPISNLSYISKLFEKIVYDRVLDYISASNLLHKNQFGFLKSCNTEAAFLFLTSLLTKSINNKKKVALIFLDYSKAFDSICHKKLCTKLRTKFYFSYEATLWFWSYLSNRTQYTYINSCSSSANDISHGVPQGSLLGPLLFNMYINDIHDIKVHSDSQYTLYADDTVVFVEADDDDSLQSKVNDELTATNNWCNDNHLILNSSKTKCIFFNCSDNIAAPSIANNIIDCVSEHKYLGYIIDNKLKFNSQLTALDKKLKICNSILAKTAYILPKASLLTIFNSIGLSHLIYNKFILIVSSNNQCRHISNKITQAFLIINHKVNTHSNNDHLNYITHYYSFIVIFKILRCNFANQLNIFIMKNRTNTRHNYNLYQTAARSLLCQKGFPFFVAKLWNSLPANIKACQTLSAFKPLLRNYLNQKFLS